jgi:hypothetical protein
MEHPVELTSRLPSERDPVERSAIDHQGEKFLGEAEDVLIQ